MPFKFSSALPAFLSVALLSRLPAFAADPPPIFVGGQFIREHAIEDGRGHLLVPVRGIFEAFHASVMYTPPRIVVVRRNGMVIAGLVVGRRQAVVANRGRMLSTAPVRRNGRIFVPLRIIAEIAGASVVYSSHPRLIDIRAPLNELSVPAVPLYAPQPVPVPPVPIWAFVFVALLVLAFLIESIVRLIAAAREKVAPKPRSAPVPLANFALQFPNSAGAGDEHDVGQVAK